MKKLLTLLVFLLLTGAAVAESSTAIDSTFVGTWQMSMEATLTSGALRFNSLDKTVTIDNSGKMTISGEQNTYQLIPGTQPGSYTTGGLHVTIDSLGTLCILNSSNTRLLLCNKKFGHTYTMPNAGYSLATGGEWQITHLKYKPKDENYSFLYSNRPWMDLSLLNVASLSMTLKPHSTSYDVQTAFKKLLDGNKGKSNLATLLSGVSITDATLHSDGVILLTLGGEWGDSAEYEVRLTRKEAPKAEEAVKTRAQQMMGTWIITEMTLGGFTLPADSLKEDYLLQIDEYGYVKLGNEQLTLTLDRRHMYLTQNDDQTLDVTWDEDAITIHDPVSGTRLNFITYAEAYWREHCGTWQLGNIRVESMGLNESPKGLDFTLTLNEDYTATLAAGEQEQHFTVTPMNSISYYELANPTQTYYLEFSSSNACVYTADANTYNIITILTFTRPDDD